MGRHLNKANRKSRFGSNSSLRLEPVVVEATCTKRVSFGSSFTIPRWLDKLLAFEWSRSVRLKEPKSQVGPQGTPNYLTFVNIYTPSFGCKCVSGRKKKLPAGEPPQVVTILQENFFFFHWQQSYLVDPASSHMLVSKIKPCMSKYKQLYTVKLRTAHYISNNLFDDFLLHG